MSYELKDHRQKDLRDLILEPVISEKSYRLIEDNVYTFKVRTDAKKPEIKDAIEKIFDVTVLKVNTLNRAGKKRRDRRTGKMGQAPSFKRAIVTLSEGDTIELFEV